MCMTTEISIEIENSERFRRQVEDGTNDPLTVLDIYVGDEHVKGGSTYVTRTLVETLEAVEGIIDNEKQIIEYSGGPSYLVFEPRDDKTMWVTGCGSIEAAKNPDERLSIDTTVEVDKYSWVVELVRTAEEYYVCIHDLNPTLDGTESIRRLQNRITNVKEQLGIDK